MRKSIKTILLMTIATLCGFVSKAQYSFVAADISGSEGSVVELPISMNNGDKDVVSFQFDLYLPEGVTVQLGDDNAPKAKLSSRASDHIITAALQRDGAYRYLSFSMTNAVYTGQNGEILTTPIILGAAPGEYTIQIKNASITLNNEAKTELECENTESTLTITEPEVIRYGDNQLYAKDITIAQGENATLQIGYNSTSDVYGYSAEVVLPSGVTVEDVTFSSAVSVKNYVNDWSFEAPVLSVSGEQGRKGELALSGDNIIALASLNTSSLMPGEYTIKVQAQYLSNDDDDYEPETYDAILTVKGSAPTAVELTDGVAYTNASDINNVDVSYTRNFPAAKWQALYIPFDMDYDDWADYGTVAEYTGVREYDTDKDGVYDKTALVFKHITSGSLKANTPYVFKPYMAGDVRFSSQNTTLYAAPAHDSAVAYSTSSDTYTIYGNYAPVEGLWSQGGYALSADGAFTHAASESQVLKPYRIYLLVTKLDGTPNRSPMLFNIIVDDATSDIEGIELMMQTDNAIYDTFGRSVEKPTSGVYIQNGKKVFIK